MHLNDDPIIRAISIRQPYAEQILRGTKRFEYHSTNTNLRERVWIYASLKDADDPTAWRKIGTPKGGLTTGLIIGSVEIVGTRKRPNGGYSWTLSHPQRLRAPLGVTNRPRAGVWKPAIVDTSASTRPFQPPLEPFAKPVYARPKRRQPSLRVRDLKRLGDFVGYHNEDKMKYPVWDTGHSLLTNRHFLNATGRRLWIITGEERPRRYWLVGWFTVDSVRLTPPAETRFKWVYQGELGSHARNRREAVEITEAPWFTELKSACANFRTLYHIRRSDLLHELRMTWGGKARRG